MAWFLLALGMLAFGLGAWGAVHGALTLRWPRADAEIVDAKLTRHERETRELRRPDRWHTFAVHFVYRIGEQTHLGGGVEPYDFNMQNSAGAVKMSEKYPIGSKVTVAYDPAHPETAYLVPGPSSFSLMLLGLGGLLCGVGLLARRVIRLGQGERSKDEQVKSGA